MNLLVGDWTYIESESSKDIGSFRQNIVEGYEFLENGVCHRKLGYYRKKSTRIPGMEKAIGDRTELTTTCFLGTETRFEIEDDILRVFDLTDSTWKSIRILRLANDTLRLQLPDNTIENYAKSRYRIDTTSLFDEVVVSTSGCFGTCPINITLIKQSGEVVYYGEDYNSRNGLYAFTLTKDEYNKVKLDFAKAGIEDLQGKYEADWTDDEEITLTFFKGGKIIKSITDYGKVGPIELHWAYRPIRSMYQLKLLDSIRSNPPLFSQPKEVISSLRFALGLSKSEAFYLWNLLRNAREVKVPFMRRYNIKIDKVDKLTTVATDGRYFAFEALNGEETIVDIGFNFIELNDHFVRIASDNLRANK